MKKIIFLLLFLTGISPVFDTNGLSLGCGMAYGQESATGLEEVILCQSPDKVEDTRTGDWVTTETCVHGNENGVATNPCIWDCTESTRFEPEQIPCNHSGFCAPGETFSQEECKCEKAPCTTQCGYGEIQDSECNCVPDPNPDRCQNQCAPNQTQDEYCNCIDPCTNVCPQGYRQTANCGCEPPPCTITCPVGYKIVNCACVKEETGEPDVKNNVKDPCISKGITNVLNGDNTNPFSNFINGDFFKEDSQSLKINGYSDSSTEGVKIDGKLAPSNMYNQTIMLNIYALDNASEEYVTATIYHEIIHSKLRSEGIEDSKHHDIMADSWRDKISSQLLKDYPSLSSSDADALAWGGLSESIKWKSMRAIDDKDKTEVTGNIAASNKNHKNLNNTTNGKYGTPCK